MFHILKILSIIALLDYIIYAYYKKIIMYISIMIVINIE